MTESDFDKKINLYRIILPLMHVKIKSNNNFKISKSYESIKYATNDIVNSLIDSNKIKKSDSEYYSVFLMETLSILHSYEIIHHNNACIDDIKDNLLEFFENSNLQKESFKKDYFEKVISTKIYSEINKFHSMLYFSGVIDFNELKKLNKNILISINKITMELILYLKTKTFSDTKYIYETIKVASMVYTDIIEVLFLNLSKNEKKMNEYIKKQDVYIKKIEELFIEQYSLLNTSCDKLQRNIES